MGQTITGPNERQLPVGDEVFLDHVGYFVADLEEAGRKLERLGFDVSPINLQQNADDAGVLRPSGTSNRLAIMRLGFLEVLAATHDTPLADHLRHELARYEGLHLIAFSHADVPAQRARLVGSGFRMLDVVRLRRHKEVDGAIREVRWTVLRSEHGEMAEGRAQFAYCETPDLTWPPVHVPPANGADALTDMLICVEDPREAAERYGRFAGRGATQEGDVHVVALDRSRLAFATPSTLRAMLPRIEIPTVPFMVGQALRTTSIGHARAALARGGVTPLFADDDLVCIRREDALGSFLLFHASHLTAPWTLLAARLG